MACGLGSLELGVRGEEKEGAGRSGREDRRGGKRKEGESHAGSVVWI
jgi:hypothetical protein